MKNAATNQRRRSHQVGKTKRQILAREKFCLVYWYFLSAENNEIPASGTVATYELPESSAAAPSVVNFLNHQDTWKAIHHGSFGEEKEENDDTEDVSLNSFPVAAPTTSLPPVVDFLNYDDILEDPVENLRTLPVPVLPPPPPTTSLQPPLFIPQEIPFVPSQQNQPQEQQEQQQPLLKPQSPQQLKPQLQKPLSLSEETSSDDQVNTI